MLMERSVFDAMLLPYLNDLLGIFFAVRESPREGLQTRCQDGAAVGDEGSGRYKGHQVASPPRQRPIAMERSRSESEPVTAQLGLWDAVSIIIGIVIGAGIFQSPPRIFGNVPGPEAALILWGLGGFL